MNGFLDMRMQPKYNEFYAQQYKLAGNSHLLEPITAEDEVELALQLKQKKVQSFAHLAGNHV